MSSRRVDRLEAFCSEYAIPSAVERAPIAIYFLIRAGEIVYVGQTANIAQRVALHRAPKRRRVHLKPRITRTFDRVLYFLVDAEEADAFEGALIRALNPRWSRRAPRDVSRDAEVLLRIGWAPNERATAAFVTRTRSQWHRARAESAA